MPANLNETEADRTSGIVNSNPGLKQDPAAAMALGSAVPTAEADGPTVGGASSAIGWLGHMTNAFKDIVPDAEKAATGIAKGTVSLVGGVADLGKTVGTDIAATATGGLVGAHGIGTGVQHANNMALEQSTAGLVADVKNPLHGVMNIWDMMAHYASFMNTMANQHGFAYAAGWALPQFAAAVAGDGALTGASLTGDTAVAAADAADSATVAGIAAKLKNGEQLTAEDNGTLTGAASRMARRQDVRNSAEGARLADNARIAQLRGVYGIAERVANKMPIGQSAGMILKGLGKVFKLGGNFRLNATMYLTEIAANGNPETAATWKKTADLRVYDKEGRNVGTFGQSLADTLGQVIPGLEKGSNAYNALSGTTDLYTKYLGSDPIRAVADLTKAARSAEGASGLLGRWWKGLGVESGTDVLRTWDNSAKSVHAYTYMATHSATEIGKEFPKMYDDTTRIALGHANTIDDVLKIHADLADGVGLTRGVAPTMGGFKYARLMLKSGLTIGKTMDEPLKALEAAAPEIKALTSLDVIPTTLTEAIGDAGTRMDTALARKAAQRVTALLEKTPMIFEEGPGGTRIEIKGFMSGNKEAIPVIGAQLRRSGIASETAVRLAEDAMEHSETATDMDSAMLEAHRAIVTEFVAAGTDDANVQYLRDAMKPMTDNQINRLAALNQYGGEGNYMNGVGNEVYEKLVSPGGWEKGGGTYGFGKTHLGHWAFMDSRALRNLAHGLRSVVVHDHDFFEGSYLKLAELGEKDLEQAAEFTGAKLSGVVGNVKTVIPESQRLLDSFSNTSGSGYKATHDLLANMVSEVAQDKSLSQTEQFFKVAKDMIWKGKNLEYRIANATEDSGQAILPTASSSLLHDKGALQAVRDYEKELFRRVQQPGVSVRSMRKWAIDQSKTVRGVEAERRAMSHKLYDNLLQSKYYENHGFLNHSNIIVDKANRILSDTFIPLCLSTGGYIFRITGAEVLLNVFRMGPREFLNSRIIASIAKAEFRGGVLKEAPNLEEAAKVIAGDVGLKRGEEIPFNQAGDTEQELTDAEKARAAGAGWVPKTSAQTEQDALRLENAKQGMTERGLIHRTVVNIAKNLYETVEGPDEKKLLGMSQSRMAAGRNMAHALRDGTLLGIQRGMLSSMGDDEMYRFLDNTTSYVMRHNGHMPDMGHGRTTGGSTALFSPEAQDRGVRDAVGIKYDANHESSAVGGMARRGEVFSKAAPEHLATAHVENLNRIFQDTLMHPSAEDLQAELALRGDRGFPLRADKDRLIERLTDLQYNRMARMDPAELEGFKSAKWMLYDKSVSTGISPLRDWAKKISANTVGSVEGVDGKGLIVLQKSLIDQAVSGKIDSEVEMAYRLASMGKAAPEEIKAASFEDYTIFKGPIRELLSKNCAKEINRLGVDKFFGKVMSWMSREPVSVWEYHLAMEAQRGVIGSGLRSLDEAEVIADNAALRRMARFVHNPSDRSVFEANVRVYSPFYFAQNQALRRALRAASEDFGAFDRYLRATLGVTHYVSEKTLKGSLATLSFPASQYITGFFDTVALDSLGYIQRVNPTEKSILQHLGIGFNMDMSSVQTLAPTGDTTNPMGMFENMFRPSAGPFVDIPLKTVHYYLNSTWYTTFMTDLLGKIGATSGISTDFLPSAVDRGLLAMTADGEQIAQNGWGATDSVIASVQVKAMHSALNNLMTKYMIEYYQSKFAATHSYPGDPAIGETAQQQLVMDARVYADGKMERYLAPGSHTLQEFQDDTHVVALAMYLAKTLVGFAAPASTTINAMFTKDTEYQKIATTKLPDGQLPSLSQAMTTFATEFPGNFLDLTSTSQSPKGSLPEDTTFLQWVQKSPGVVEAIPALLSYTANRNSAYVPSMFSILHTMGLRTADTPQQYVDAINTALGDDIWYNSIEPMVYYESKSAYFGANNPNNNLNATGTKDLKAAAYSFGKTYNTTWYTYGSYGALAGAKKVDAVNQLYRFADDGAMQAQVAENGLMSGQTITNLRTLATTYKLYVTAINQAIANGNTGSSQKEQMWAEFAVLANEPKYKNEKYLITSVLQGAPTAK